jgi:hypothetical protein
LHCCASIHVLFFQFDWSCHSRRTSSVNVFVDCIFRIPEFFPIFVVDVIVRFWTGPACIRRSTHSSVVPLWHRDLFCSHRIMINFHFVPSSDLTRVFKFAMDRISFRKSSDFVAISLFQLFQISSINIHAWWNSQSSLCFTIFIIHSGRLANSLQVGRFIRLLGIKSKIWTRNSSSVTDFAGPNVVESSGNSGYATISPAKWLIAAYITVQIVICNSSGFRASSKEGFRWTPLWPQWTGHNHRIVSHSVPVRSEIDENS